LDEKPGIGLERTTRIVEIVEKDYCLFEWEKKAKLRLTGLS
jgi:hypothetical protein